MPSKDLVFRLFGEDVNASASMRKLSRTAEESSRGIHRAFGDAPRDFALVAAAATAASVKMAGDFQAATTRLVTDAGEQQANLEKVRGGLLDISSQTGLTAKDTAAGMYLIESAGYHGAAGLNVMKAAAEGAKIGGAEIKTVADALTTTMTDFGAKAGTPAQVMSKLISTVSVGKTTMEDLAGSLHNVLPGAESAGIGLNQVLGAMGTMTAEGISADQASQNLNHSILALSNPTQVQAKAMAAVGLSAFEVAKSLGKKGLTGTYDELTNAITAHMKGGVVVETLFNTSKQAAQSATAELKTMPPAIKGIAQAYLNGSITQKQWTTDIKAQTPLNANLLKQFGATAGAAHGFSDAVKSGQGPFATYNAQLAKMTGGQVGLGVALHLSGIHSGAFASNVKTIGGATAEAGGHVKGWAETQKNFNQQMAQAGATLAATGIRIGTVLLPPLTKVAKGFGGFFKDLQNGVPGARILAGAVVGITGAMVGLYVAQKVANTVMFAARAGLMLFRGALVAWSAATKIAAAVQMAFNLIMDANPIGLIVLAIVALIAIIVLLVTHWKQVCAFLQTVWGAVCKWFSDTLTSIGKWWNQTWSAVMTVVHNVMGWIGANWPLILSILTGPIGAAVIFIVTHWSQILEVVKTVIGNLKSFFAGAAGWLLDAGKHIIDGLVNGIKGAVGAVTSAVSGVASNVIGTFKGLLGIHSPSTVFREMGHNIGEGLTLGLLGSQKQVEASTNRLASTVIGMFQKGTIGRRTELTALAQLESGTTRMEALAKRRATVEANLKKATSTVKRDLKDRASEAASVRGNVLQGGDITQMGSAGDIVQNLQGLVTRTRRFKTVLSALVKKGIDKATFSEIVNAGVDGGGLSTAEGLLANPIDLKEIVGLQKQLESAATGFGNMVAGHDYAGRLKADQRHVASLTRDDRHLKAEQRTIAAHTVRQVGHTVHIHVNGVYAGDKHALAKTVHKAVVDATRAGHLPKGAMTHT